MVNLIEVGTPDRSPEKSLELEMSNSISSFKIQPLKEII